MSLPPVKIALTGFMGAGKSSVGELLATQCGVPFIDLDAEITRRSGLESVQELFSVRGEEHFRALEREVCSEVARGAAAVIATGGGAIIDLRNESAFKMAGTVVVLLDAPFEELARRVASADGGVSRPLFQSLERAHALYSARQSRYRESADLIISTAAKKPAEIACEIMLALGRPVARGLVEESTENTPQRCLVIGDPVGHSLSPDLHTTGYRALGIEHLFSFCARRVAAQELAGCIAEVRRNGIRGVACTIPHKQAVAALCDRLDPRAQAIGAVNTVVNDQGVLTGFNTDVDGVLRPLAARIKLAGRRVAILGAGGAARAALFGLLEAGSDVTVFSRSLPQGEQLVKGTAAHALPLTALNEISAAEIVINSTPVGMSPRPEAMPIPANTLHSGQIVFDMVYNPFETALLREARQRGAVVVYGAEMFLHQALRQFSLFTGREAPREAFRAFLSERFNAQVP